MLETDHPEDAVKALAPYVRKKEPPLTILAHYAWALTAANKEDEAFRTYEKTVRLYPKDANTRRNLGILLMNRQQWNDAAKALETAYALQTTQDKEPGLLVQAAYAAMQETEYAHALSLIDKAEAVTTTIPVSWTTIAVSCCQHLKRKGDALSRTRRCVRSHPDEATAWRLHGQVLAWRKAPLSAASAFEIANSLRPETVAHANAELAALYAQGHAYTEAARTLAAVAPPSLRLARLHFLAGEYQSALDVLDALPSDASQSAKIRLETARAGLLRGRALIRLGQNDRAVNALVSAGTHTRMAGDTDAIDHVRGNCLLLAGGTRWLQGDWSDAATIFTRLAAIPGYGNTGTSLASSMRSLINEGAMAHTP